MPAQIIRAAVCAVLSVMAAYALLFANDGLGGIGIDVGVSHDSVTVGDVIAMSVTLSVPKDTRIIPPETGRGFGDFVVLSATDSVIAGDSADTVAYRYSLAIFKPENCTIPALTFLALTFLAGTGTLYDTLLTPPLPIAVISVIPSDTPDSGLVIRGLKAQQETGGADLRFLWVLAAAAAAVLAYFLLRKYVKKKPGAAAAARLKPPYEEALEAIVILKEKKYLERGAVREYTFELSEIFKRYIGRRYDSAASELTSEEIIDWFKSSPVDVEVRLCAERFFRTSDQVKFAKWKPDQQTVDSFMRDVKAFLEATKPEPELQTEQRAETAGTAQ